MKIGFVAEPYEESHASGMGYAVLQTVKNFMAEGKQHEFVIYSSTPVRKEVIPGVYQNILVPKNFFKKLFWFYFMHDKPDVLVFMLPLLPLIVSRNIKAVPMFHELGSQKIKPGGMYNTLVAFVRDRLLTPISLSRAQHIVTISHATESDLLEHYRLQREKITVIYVGYQDWSRFKDDSVGVLSGMEPFFFFAGKVKFRKNVHGLVEGFIRFKERTHANCKLVIAGDHSGPYVESIMQNLRAHRLDSEVSFVGYVSNAQMYAFFSRALACVFASFNEGFGMPIAEAMSLGTPVITSNVSATAEVVGDAGLLVDPHDAEDISWAMEKIYTDDTLRRELISKGYERAKQFSWVKTAREYLDLLEKL